MPNKKSYDKQYHIDKLQENMVNDTILDIIPKNKNYSDGTVMYKHNTCGLISENSTTTIRKTKKEYCAYCFSGKCANTETSFLLKFQKRNDCKDYIFLTKFVDLHMPIKIKHNCGYEFETLPAYLLYDNSKCPKCMNRTPSNSKALLMEKIKMADTNNEYEILDVYEKNGKFCIKSNADMRHKTCGQVSTFTVHNFISNNRRCHFCNKIKISNQLKKLDKVHSKQSDLIEKTLSDLNIKFVREKRFSDLKYKRQLPLDFYFTLNDTCYAIEYDGKEHFEFNKSSTIFTQKDIELIKLRDSIKTEYCKNNNIVLLRFNYKQSDDQIKNILIQKFSSETIESM